MECREKICFPGNHQLEYVIQPSSGTAITASLSEQVICVEVPRRDLAEWCASDQVGLYAEVTGDGASPLQIRIERDFRCLDPRITEDQPDTFENPLASHADCAVSQHEEDSKAWDA